MDSECLRGTNKKGTSCCIIFSITIIFIIGIIIIVIYFINLNFGQLIDENDPKL